MLPRTLSFRELSKGAFSVSGFLFAALIMAFAPLPQPEVPPTTRIFQVTASSYEFSPLTSADVVHGLYIDGYDIHVTADPGQTQTLTFTADKSGTFRLRCSVTCGDMHPFMIGKLHVGRNLLLWRGIGLGTIAFIALIMFGRSHLDQSQQSPKVDP
jgi:hypothetical protein